MFLGSCNDRDTEEFLELSQKELVVVVHTPNGELIDYLVVEELEGIEKIEVVPEIPATEVQVTVFGKKRSPEMRKNFSIATEIAVGYRGRIDVHVDDGEAVGMFGNGMDTPSPITGDTLRFISDEIARGGVESRRTDTIKIVKKTEQVADGDTVEDP
jgi:hypothetical protein